MERKAFEGIKVGDFSWYAAGPAVTKYLADHGANVIRVESRTRLDGFRTTGPFKDGKPGIDHSATFALYNASKYGVTLNLRHPQGLEVAKKIVAWADIVVENFTPGTVKRLGLDYEELQKIKPDIIMLSTCNQGQTGPHSKQPGFGSHLVSASGFTHLTGWPDRPPSLPAGPYTDFIAACYGALCVVAALDYRRRTGKGLYLDLSQYESSLQMLAPLILDFTVNRRVANRMGSRCPNAAPHGAYPCRGEDRWCVIAVFSDEEWRGFCQAIGNPEWTKDPRFATLNERKRNEDELDRLVGEWTCDFTAEDVTVRLQAAGVNAGVVKNCSEPYSDPQMKHRGYFRQLDHPVIGKHTYPGYSFKLSKTPEEIRCGPCFGQDNEYVYTKILGMSDEEFLELLNAGVFD